MACKNQRFMKEIIRKFNFVKQGIDNLCNGKCHLSYSVHEQNNNRSNEAYFGNDSYNKDKHTFLNLVYKNFKL